MRDRPADKLYVGNFVHPETISLHCQCHFGEKELLDIQGEREEDPDRRADDHREEQQDQLQAVPGPAQTASPELVQVRLNLHKRIFSSGLVLV